MLALIYKLIKWHTSVFPPSEFARVFGNPSKKPLENEYLLLKSAVFQVHVLCITLTVVIFDRK